MKKTALLSLLALSVSGSALAETFTGFSVGAEVSSSKHNFELAGYNYVTIGSRATTLGIIGGYGFDFAGNFVGQAEVKLRTGGSKTHNTNGETISKENYNFGIAYLQGYRLNDVVLPYIKLGFDINDMELNDEAIRRDLNVQLERSGSSLVGVTYGVGIKFAVTPQIEATTEYTQTRYRGMDIARSKADKIGLNVAYRF